MKKNVYITHCTWELWWKQLNQLVCRKKNNKAGLRAALSDSALLGDIIDL